MADIFDQLNDQLKKSDSNQQYVEKFRPKKMTDIISHENIVKTLQNFIINQNIPHFLFCGPPGTGKTSTIHSFVNELYGEENIEYMVMNINASEERGIEVVRTKISDFVGTRPVYRKKIPGKRIPSYKIVILDEADAMTTDAQNTLRGVIETNTKNARFCLICNHIKGIDYAIKSRCIMFKFNPISYDSALSKIKDISEKNNISITDDGISMIWKLSCGDMRKMLHILQVASTVFDHIDQHIIAEFQKYPLPDEIHTMYHLLHKGIFLESYDYINRVIKEKSYSFTDILTELTEKLVEELIHHTINNKRAFHILKNLRDIEMNIIVTSDTDIQLCAIIASFNY